MKGEGEEGKRRTIRPFFVSLFGFGVPSSFFMPMSPLVSLSSLSPVQFNFQSISSSNKLEVSCQSPGSSIVSFSYLDL